ncbi:hypothetical protein [Variovorax fucosicus]|uniref:hypothetical protein n=1 Tax=Variovorax fucosicus TaxID=3053517 RepID=UPI0025777416|nr:MULTISPECIES: hypothetical protein [unclassified Variovorax]MDM0059263.1 hypothetical protein [Variovorax sp. J22G47]
MARKRSWSEAFNGVERWWQVEGVPDSLCDRSLGRTGSPCAFENNFAGPKACGEILVHLETFVKLPIDIQQRR